MKRSKQQKRQMVECPRCHKRMTVTFLSEYDKKTCACGGIIYANYIGDVNSKYREVTLLKKGLRGLFR